MFLWCHARYLTLDGTKLCRITEKDKETAKSLNYSSVDFPVSKKDYGKIEVLNKINVNVSCYETKQFTLFICSISVLMMF